ncbi:MAG: DciA family protein [Betaproteobacteria bacterium]|nr:DciA family protein [Betaproteobacteria bacterium]
MRPPKIDRYLTADGGLRPVVEKAREIAALSRLCESVLPPEIARQVRAANLKDGTLVLLAPNSAAAAKLRLLSESLCNFLLLQGTKVNLVSVRVQPTASRRTPDAASHKQARLSPAALAELDRLYETLADSPAREALKALLAHQDTTRPPAPPAAAKSKAAAGQGRRRGGGTR